MACRGEAARGRSVEGGMTAPAVFWPVPSQLQLCLNPLVRPRYIPPLPCHPLSFFFFVSLCFVYFLYASIAVLDSIKLSGQLCSVVTCW